MLDQLRKHASNWAVKAVLALIIFTFIAFFGWSRIANRYQDAHLYVAAVNGEGIPRPKFENMLQESLDQLRKSVEGSLPENMEQLLRNNVLDQLITRILVAKYAKRLGLSVTDEEVAQYIRNNTSLFASGDFDLRAYERNFLPSYRQRYGEDFEDVVRRDLLIQKVQTVAMTLFEPWEEELDRSLDEIQTALKGSGPEAETAPVSPIASASPMDLFTRWIEDFRKTAEIETY